MPVVGTKLYYKESEFEEREKEESCLPHCRLSVVI